MSKTLVTLEDHTIQFAATATARSSGDVVDLNGVILVMKLDVAANGTGAAYQRGVHDVTKQTNAGISKGAKVYFNSNSQMTSLSAGNTYAGRAYNTTTTGTTSQQVTINFGEA